MGPAVFKTVVGGEEPPGCVRFAHGSATEHHAPANRRGFDTPEHRMSRAEKSLRAVVISLCIALAAALGGCSRAASVLQPSPKVVTVEATVAAPGASVRGTLAPGMPDGIPLWPGAEVRQSGEVRNGYEFVLATNDAFDDVVKGLAAGFERAGWEVAEEVLADGTPDDTAAGGASGPASGPDEERVTALTALKGADSAVITVTQKPDHVTIFYVLTPGR